MKRKGPRKYHLRRNGGTRRCRGAGTAVPEAAVSEGTVESDAAVAYAEGWVDAGIPQWTLVQQVGTLTGQFPPQAAAAELPID